MSRVLLRAVLLSYDTEEDNTLERNRIAATVIATGELPRKFRWKDDLIAIAQGALCVNVDVQTVAVKTASSFARAAQGRLNRR